MSTGAKVIVDDGGRREVPLAGGPFVMGRSQECQLVLKGDGTASRKHAEIRSDGGRWLLADLGSGNGTTVNGKRVMETALQNGDRISIAGVEILFSCSPPAATGAPAARPDAGAGTESLDMNQVMRKMTDETAALDSPPTFSADDDGDPESKSEKKKFLVLAGAAGGLVLLLVAVFAFLPGKTARTGPVFEPFARLSTNVNENAYVTLEHTELRPRDPTILRAVSKSDGQSEIIITGLKPGKTVLEVLTADPDRGWEVEVEVTVKQPWPPGWTDDDRLAAAADLKKEADSSYPKLQSDEQALVRVYHTYAKVVRLYENCTYQPPEPFQQAQERRDELKDKIEAKERSLVIEFRRLFRTHQQDQALTLLDELLALFPPDGEGTDLLSKHGDDKKYRQYFILRERVLSSRKSGS